MKGIPLLAGVLGGWLELPLSFTSILGLMGIAFAVTGAFLTLRGALGLGRSLRHRARARRHPLEPWRWDHPWELELRDESLSIRSFLRALLVPLLVTGALGASLAGSLLFLLLGARSPFERAAVGMMSLVLAFTLYMALKSFWANRVPERRQWRRRLRLGPMRLRLDRIPLALGTRARVELAVPRELTALPDLNATLRCVRAEEQSVGSGGDASIQTHYSDLYEQHPRVAAGAVGPGRNLVITLELPPPEPRLSTWKGHTEQVYWELRLLSVARDVDLDTTFRLPVYKVPARS